MEGKILKCGCIKKCHCKNIHHRRPASTQGDSSPENISLVLVEAHKAWHLLFSVKNPYEIADIINKIWLDPRFRFEVFPVFPSSNILQAPPPKATDIGHQWKGGWPYDQRPSTNPWGDEENENDEKSRTDKKDQNDGC